MDKIPPKSEEEELQEKDFIQESYSRDPFPMWASILAFIIMALAIYAFSSWIGEEIDPVQDEIEIELTEGQNPSS